VDFGKNEIYHPTLLVLRLQHTKQAYRPVINQAIVCDLLKHQKEKWDVIDVMAVGNIHFKILANI
jgi:hypothetical protein